MKVRLQSFLTSARNVDDRSAGRLYATVAAPWRKVFRYPWIGSCVGPTRGLEAVETKRSLVPANNRSQNYWQTSASNSHVSIK